MIFIFKAPRKVTCDMLAEASGLIERPEYRDVFYCDLLQVTGCHIVNNSSE